MSNDVIDCNFSNIFNLTVILFIVKPLNHFEICGVYINLILFDWILKCAWYEFDYAYRLTADTSRSER